MSLPTGDDFQDTPQGDETSQPEVELEAGPRAERPNFLTATRFVDFDLPPEILEGLDKAGFEYCTPIQAQAIPVAMSGQDIAGQAQTGTGKTTAFLVPLLNRLLKNKPMEPGVPRALIVTPTRELALQIHEDALVLGSATELRQALVIGGIEYKEQAELLASGPEIVICTPGRIIDYLQQGIFKAKGIEVAVVDEADRLLDMGFIKDLKLLLGKLPSFDRRQTMLFSATLDERVMELTYQYMNPPQYITAEPDKATKINIEQELYHISRDEKLSLLMGFLRREEHQRVIIFCNTKSGVEWLSKKLTMNGFQAEGITGDLPQPKRLRLMEAFKENRLQILVATDVASRGIHVDDVSHVYNYDLPQDAENYVHRIGRTARAGHTGKAVSFGCEDYVFHLEAIENLLGYKIPVFWAEQEWFQEDQGGEVRLKERSGNDRRKMTGRGRESGGGRVSRGPAKSQRPGGIFGLSPRFSPNAPDERQHLGWTTAGDEELIVEAEIIEVSADNGTPSEVPEREGRPDRDRRRKRRRGRRGSAATAEIATPAESAVSEIQAEPEIPEAAKVTPEPSRYPTTRVDGQSPSPAVAAELPPQAEAVADAAEAAPPKKATAKKPRRAATKKVSAAASPNAPIVVEADAAKAESPAAEVKAPAKAAKSKTKAAPKERRSDKKADSEASSQVDAVAAEAKPPVETVKSATKKASRTTKKTAKPAEKVAAQEKTPEPVEKKASRTKKKAEPGAESVQAVKKAATKTAAKASAAAAAAKADKADKKAESTPVNASAKKAPATEAEPKKTRPATKKAGEATAKTRSKTTARSGGSKKSADAKKAETEEQS